MTEQRRALPGGVAADYEFRDENGKTVGWDALFGEQDTLVTYFWMYGPQRERPVRCAPRSSARWTCPRATSSNGWPWRVIDDPRGAPDHAVVERLDLTLSWSRDRLVPQAGVRVGLENAVEPHHRQRGEQRQDRSGQRQQTRNLGFLLSTVRRAERLVNLLEVLCRPRGSTCLRGTRHVLQACSSRRTRMDQPSKPMISPSTVPTPTV